MMNHSKVANELRKAAENAKAWPFEEARKIVARLKGQAPAKGYVLFETGYGPSGLPHIGTFGEVLRTTMVRRAFELLSDIPTKLICFSDDMDGLRKVPTNVPNQDMLRKYLNKPLTKVPDPFGKYESFGHHNNAMLCKFLDQFGFEYEFASSSHYYQSGKFDQGLLKVLENYDQVMKIMLPSLREERAQNYSPFLPIDPISGNVLQVAIESHDLKAGTISYYNQDKELVTTKVTGGLCKLQWKPDWGMRWHVLSVDYEMSGKDLIDSFKLSSRICQSLGTPSPEGFNYELFLDQNGEKISKSRGNGLTMEEWLHYAPDSSLAYFMYGKPRTGKRLYFDIIPKNVDEYQTQLTKFESQPIEEQIENPIWHIYSGKPPEGEKSPLPFALILNLVAASNSADKNILWGFISRYLKDATPVSEPALDKLVGYAINYYKDFVLPHKAYRMPDARDVNALADLRDRLFTLSIDQASDIEAVQTIVYEVGKDHEYENLRDWFQAQYAVLLGQEQGPRIGSFYVIYGIDRSITLIDEALKRNNNK